MTTPATASLDLGKDLTIPQLAELYIQSLRLLNDEQPIKVEISEISMVDTAGVQFLLNLSKAAAQAKQSLQFSNPSQVLTDRIKCLGLEEKLPV